MNTKYHQHIKGKPQQQLHESRTIEQRGASNKVISVKSSMI
jgi:hypothetical protein